MDMLKQTSFQDFTVKSKDFKITFPVEAYLEPYKTCNIDFFAEIANGWKMLTIFAKSFIFDFDWALNTPFCCTA